MEGEEERPEGGDLKLEVEEVSFGLFLSSGFWHQVSGIRFLASGFKPQVSVFLKRGCDLDEGEERPEG